MYNMVMYTREIKTRIERVSKTFRVLVVTGPRQVGKTTLLESMMPPGMMRISLDDEALRHEARENPKLFLDTYRAPLFIDEVQYAPELFPYIKMKVDEAGEMGMYWLSGSQAFSLMKNVSESLAGRAGIVEMNSFTCSEILSQVEGKQAFDPEHMVESELLDVNQVYEIIFNGGMPELYRVRDLERNEFFNSYIDTFIERDVRRIKDIGNLEDFRRFMKDLAIRNGKPLNYSDIASEIGVSSNTIKEWVSVLVSTRVVYLLQPFYSNKLDRLTHRQEIVFMDSGLAAYLADWESAFELQTSEFAGPFLEAYVISELVKSYDNAGKKINFSYLRNKETEEIDLIIEKNQRLYPFEIKKTANPKREMLNNFRLLTRTDKEIGNGGLICLYDKMFRFNEKQYVLPLASVINPH